MIAAIRDLARMKLTPHDATHYAVGMKSTREVVTGAMVGIGIAVMLCGGTWAGCIAF